MKIFIWEEKVSKKTGLPLRRKDGSPIGAWNTFKVRI